MNSKISDNGSTIIIWVQLEENEKKEEIANINDFPKMYCKSYEHLKLNRRLLFEQKIITFCMNVWQNLIN